MASNSYLSTNSRGQSKKPAEVTCYPKEYNYRVQTCALASTILENPNKTILDMQVFLSAIFRNGQKKI